MEWSQLPIDNPSALPREVLRLLRTSDQPWRGIESVELDLAHHLIECLRNEVYTEKDEVHVEACRECIRVLGKRHQLEVADWLELPTDDSWEPAVMRILQSADKPWRGIELVRRDDIPNLTNFLQKAASTTDDESYREACTRCLQALGKRKKFAPRDWSSLPSDKAWNGIGFIQPPAASPVMDFLQDKLDPGVSHETYAKNLYIQENSLNSVRALSGGAFSDVHRGCLQAKTVLRRSNTNGQTKPSPKIFFDKPLVSTVKFLGIVRVPPTINFGLVSQSRGIGEIMPFLQQNPSLGLKVIRDIAAALRYLQIAHGDIRLTNILVNIDLLCCPTDFDLSPVAEPQTPAGSEMVLQRSVQRRPPQMIDDSPFNLSYMIKADIYSFACTILEIYTAQPSFSHIRTDGALKTHKNNPPRPSLDVLSSDELLELVMSCLSTPAEDRPSAAAVLDTLRGIQISEVADSKHSEAPTMTASVGVSPTPESSNCTLSARPILPVHVQQHLLLHQDAIYELFDHKVGLSKDHVLLTAAFDEDALSLNDVSLAGDFAAAECAHISCDTDFAVEDSNQADRLRQLLLDVGKELSPHFGILQTPSYRFRIYSGHPDSVSGTSDVSVSCTFSPSSQPAGPAPGGSRVPDGHVNPDHGAPTDTQRRPDPTQSLSVGNDPTSSVGTPTGTSGQPGATPESDPGPPAETPEQIPRAIFKIAFKFNKSSPLLLEQEVLVTGAIETKNISNSPVLPDVVSSSQVEFLELDFQPTRRGTQGPKFCYHQFHSCVAIQTPQEHPIILSDRRPVSSQSCMDGSVKVVEAKEETQAMELGGTLTLGTTPSMAFTGKKTTTDKAAFTNEYTRKVMRIQQYEIKRRGLGWRYHIRDSYLQEDGLRLTDTPSLLPLVQLAFRGRNAGLVTPDKLDVTVLSFWRLPAQFCQRESNGGWRELTVLWLNKRKRDIPIRNFGVEVRLQVPTHLTTGSVVEKDVDVGSDYIDTVRLKQSVTDYHSVGDLEATPSVYAVTEFKADSLLES